MLLFFCFIQGTELSRRLKNPPGGGYIKTFLKRRFFPVWLNFALCIFLFLLTDSILGTIKQYTWWQIALSFTGWTSIGNSNWFMFDTFVLYLLIFVTFRFINCSDYKWNLFAFSGLTVLFVVVLFFTKNSTWWNTVFCFPLGMWYGYFKEKIEVNLKKPTVHWRIGTAVLLAFGVLFLIRYRFYRTVFIIVSVLFALIVVLITMKVKLGNPVLRFLGNHLFSIYILQRIPFMVLQPKIGNRYVYFVASFIITLIMAVLYDKAFHKLINTTTNSRIRLS